LDFNCILNQKDKKSHPYVKIALDIGTGCISAVPPYLLSITESHFIKIVPECPVYPLNDPASTNLDSLASRS